MFIVSLLFMIDFVVEVVIVEEIEDRELNVVKVNIKGIEGRVVLGNVVIFFFSVFEEVKFVFVV